MHTSRGPSSFEFEHFRRRASRRIGEPLVPGCARTFLLILFVHLTSCGLETCSSRLEMCSLTFSASLICTRRGHGPLSQGWQDLVPGGRSGTRTPPVTFYVYLCGCGCNDEPSISRSPSTPRLLSRTDPCLRDTLSQFFCAVSPMTIIKQLIHTG